MFTTRILLLVITILLQMLLQLCDDSHKRKYIKFEEGSHLAMSTMNQFIELFDVCFDTTMRNQKFVSNNIHSYINYPSKTTVGYSPKFTTNRKFFANMIGTVAFKNMLETDVQELKKDLIKKIKFCDEVVMDQHILNEYYDREVDLSKL